MFSVCLLRLLTILYCFHHSKIIFISSRHRVISSIYVKPPSPQVALADRRKNSVLRLCLCQTRFVFGLRITNENAVNVARTGGNCQLVRNNRYARQGRSLAAGLIGYPSGRLEMILVYFAACFRLCPNNLAK